MRRRKKHHRRSRRRMSGIGATSGGFQLEIGAVAGSVAAALINKALANQTNLTPTVKGGAKVILGGLLSKMSNNTILKGSGLGMIGFGSYELLTGLGLLNGIGQADDEMLAVSLDGIGADVLGASDMDDLSVINGDVDVVNGIGADVLGATDDTDEYIM